MVDMLIVRSGDRAPGYGRTREGAMIVRLIGVCLILAALAAALGAGPRCSWGTGSEAEVWVCRDY